MNDNNDKNQSVGGSLLRWIGRMIIIAIILAIVSFLTPGFSINGLWSYLLAAVIISLLDYLVEKLMGINATPFGNGIKGFLISAVILYLAQFVVPNMHVNIWGALIGALVVGIVDAFFPNQVFEK
ncbi:phage holin family protein [Scatolibacter rhodanostii]|uniref:phage holin family protein n=1 Tax=Scatolibacter rhodanostii TaxID=2014781 RepID=UPI000C0791A6|nr:phage holin family protein [Scatolibacter rhodanostii]